MVHVEALWAHTQADISCCVPSTSSPRTDGHGKLPSTVPDTITTWVGQGVALSKEEGIGFSNMASLTVFKSFFVSLELPYSVNFGETVTIKPVVFNYLSRNVLVCEHNPLHIHLHAQTDICRPAHMHTQHAHTQQTHLYKIFLISEMHKRVCSCAQAHHSVRTVQHTCLCACSSSPMHQCTVLYVLLCVPLYPGDPRNRSP